MKTIKDKQLLVGADFAGYPLKEAVCAHLPQGTQVSQDDERVTVAVIGRPNVGKSSLVNYILGEERMIVADEAGKEELL